MSSTVEDGPERLILDKYMPTKFSTEVYERDFQASWYKIYSWLGYFIQRSVAYCYACGQYGNDNCIEFKNWKKTHKFSKHSKSESHKTSMVKWMSLRASTKANKSVMTAMESNHASMIERNRRYLRIIIECLMYTAQQNIPQRGHTECRSNINYMSDNNCGNFIELLHLRCNDNPWLSDMLESNSIILSGLLLIFKTS